ncbi:MAG: tryptophan 7-halogenase [Acetatifactor sp.]|nr:tryptophan 7-halogenase [Acetatifactor sp.]
MQIEVPSDKYEAAVEAMQEKIRQGKIPGVSDPKKAKEIVRKGHFTYQQVKNIAKAGTVESITYDAVNGIIIASCAFGVSAMITLAANLWNGEDFNKSIKLATYSGLKVGGTAFLATVIASQLSKAGLNSALVGSSEAIVAMMGPKASAVLINAFRNGSNIYGAAAMKSAAKLLRGNVITACVTVVVLSAFDVANIFRGRISGKQLFKNVANTTVMVGAGTSGWLAGAAVGTAIFPGVGTVVGIAGGLIGSVVAGGVAGKASNALLGIFVEDDAEEMIRIIQDRFKKLSEDYLLTQNEAEKIVDNLSKELDGKKLKDMFASKDRNKYADDMLDPIIEKQVKKRQHIKEIDPDIMAATLKEVLEEIADVTS